MVEGLVHIVNHLECGWWWEKRVFASNVNCLLGVKWGSQLCMCQRHINMAGDDELIAVKINWAGLGISVRDAKQFTSLLLCLLGNFLLFHEIIASFPGQHNTLPVFWTHIRLLGNVPTPAQAPNSTFACYKACEISFPIWESQVSSATYFFWFLAFWTTPKEVWQVLHITWMFCWWDHCSEWIMSDVDPGLAQDRDLSETVVFNGRDINANNGITHAKKRLEAHLKRRSRMSWSQQKRSNHIGQCTIEYSQKKLTNIDRSFAHQDAKLW